VARVGAKAGNMWTRTSIPHRDGKELQEALWAYVKKKKLLPSNGREDATVNTSVCVIVNCKV
jgi:hypothetical protein